MTYKIYISNIRSHEFHYAQGILPLHTIVCDTRNELTGEILIGTVLKEPGPERKWAEIEKNGYVHRYLEEELSTKPKPGVHYRYIQCGSIIKDCRNPIYAIDIPTPTNYRTEAEAKNDETVFRILKVYGTVYLCAFAKGQPWNAIFKDKKICLDELPAVYCYEEFRKLPFTQWMKTKEGADLYWLEPESFEECRLSFDEVFAALPDVAIPKNQVSGNMLFIDNEAYRIEEEPD